MRRNKKAGPRGPAFAIAAWLFAHRHALDFHKGVLGQRGRLERGAGGVRLAEKAGVYGVHGRKIPDVFQQHGGLDHIGHGQPGGVQNAADIGQGLMGLGGDVLAGKGAGGGVDGQLARNVDGIARLNGN